MRSAILVIFLACVSAANAQSCDKVLFFGKVVDSLRPQSFYNLMVVNRSNGRGVFGHPNGSFSVYANDGDTVALSVKDYPLLTVVVKANTDCQHSAVYYLEPKAQEIAEVVVKPVKTLNEIREEREALALRETRTVTGIEVMQSPITALYQAFSKKERAKRWVAEQEYKDDQRRVVKELLRTYVAFDIIELTEAEFDDFLDFLNLSDDFLKTASEMELITYIQDKYEHYMWMKTKKGE
jgi:hypothetical protein